MKQKELELLSPAQNLDYGRLAIDSGADAVYIGGPSFGARASAGNSLDDISKLVDYAHLFSAKVYLTLNTLLFEEEVEAARELVWEYYNMGVDALIIQDLALLELELPPIQLHASTQLNNYSKHRLSFLYNSGITRAVLARELSLNQIESIHNYCPELELEAFVHGALCSGLSGICYLSLYTTSRSGNRGVCAQPCRNRYDLLNEEGKLLLKDKYILSPKDLNASELIPEMINSGVTSFKIEGRLKDSYYLQNITSYYSRILDDIIDKNPDYKRSSSPRLSYGFEPDPEKSFNRGFTEFYLRGRDGLIGDPDFSRSKGEYLGRVERVDNNRIMLDRPVELSNADGLIVFTNQDQQGFLVNGFDNPWILPNRQLDISPGNKVYRNFNNSFEKEIDSNPNIRKIGLDAILNETEDGFRLDLESESEIRASSSVVFNKEPAKNIDNYETNILKSIDGLGNTSFYLRGFKNNLSQKYFLPVSLIKNLRREAIEALERNIISSHPRPKPGIRNKDYPYPKTNADYSDNIINSYSKRFLESRGVESIEEGLDKTRDFENKVIFTSRHCVLHQLGYCILKKNLPKDFQGNLYIEDNKNRFRIDFDCKECLMKLVVD